LVRILKTKTCPHCRAALEQPTPRVCPVCGGSLQQRFFTAGCLSSAPPLIAIALGAYALFAAVRTHAERTTAPARVVNEAPEAERETQPIEHVANGARRP